jgi:predicted N-formylglutamate amidohydrolase
MSQKWLITCEHGGYEIPEWLSGEMKVPEPILHSHQGWDIGALGVARFLAPSADAFFEMTVSRLCIELNRSLHHQNLFSIYSKVLSPSLKNRLIQEVYHPYRNRVENRIAEWLSLGNSVIHLSIHSFTPVLNGVAREAEIGFLYDSKRSVEREFCLEWQAHLKKHDPRLRIRLNYPYRGSADGLTTALRKKFKSSEGRYLGVEVELNQSWLKKLSAEEVVNKIFSYGREK